jgi:hypothetical protein
LIRYNWKGKKYQILTNEGKERDKQILKDFLYCEEKKDWITIKNRITNGTIWGWLKEVKEDEQGFW